MHPPIIALSRHLLIHSSGCVVTFKALERTCPGIPRATVAHLVVAICSVRLVGSLHMCVLHYHCTCASCTTIAHVRPAGQLHTMLAHPAVLRGTFQLITVCGVHECSEFVLAWFSCTHYCADTAVGPPNRTAGLDRGCAPTQ